MKLEHTEDFAYDTRMRLETKGDWGDLNASGPIFWGQLADLYFIEVIQVAPWFD